MKGYGYIIAKQTQWAMNSGIPLIGSKGPRGRPTYCSELNQYLFEPLEPDVFQSFLKGDGNEIIGTPSPDNSSGCQELGGTGFPACAKNTLLISGFYFTFIFQ